jgi:hypothetical protein
VSGESRKPTRPRLSGTQEKPVPRFRCIGGPMNGEFLSVLDLPTGAPSSAPGSGGRVTVRRDEYVTGLREGARVWLWEEVRR